LQLAREGQDNYLDHLRNWFNAVFSFDAARIVQWISQSEDLGKEGLKNFLAYALQLIEHGIRLQSLGVQDMNLPMHEQKFLERLQSKALSINQYEQMAEHVNTAIYHIERNINVRTLLSALTMEMNDIVSSVIAE